MCLISTFPLRYQSLSCLGIFHGVNLVAFTAVPNMRVCLKLIERASLSVQWVKLPPMTLAFYISATLSPKYSASSSLSTNMPGKGRRWPKYAGACHLHGRPQWSYWLNPGHCNHLDSFYNPVLQINKSFSKNISWKWN